MTDVAPATPDAPPAPGPAPAATPSQSLNPMTTMLWRCPTCGTSRKTWKAASKHEVRTGHSMHRELAHH